MWHQEADCGKLDTLLVCYNFHLTFAVLFVKLRGFFFVMLGTPGPVGAAPRGHLTAEGPAAVLLLPAEDWILCPLLLRL